MGQKKKANKDILKKLILAAVVTAFSFTSFAAEKKEQSRPVNITVKEGKEWFHKYWIVPILFYVNTTPQIAVWCEDENGKFLETLYITEKISKWAKTGERKEALPVWNNKRTAKQEIDGIAGPTKNNGVNYAAKLNAKSGKIKIFAEVNNSMDYNNFYSENGGNGTLATLTSGQPSLIYCGEFDLSGGIIEQELVLAGCGSHNGKNGEIYKDTGKISTALEIVDYIKIRIEK